MRARPGLRPGEALPPEARPRRLLRAEGLSPMPVHPKDASRRKRLRHLALGTVSLGLGVLLLWKQTGFFLPAVSVLALLILLGGIARLWNWAAQKPRKPQELFLGLICLLLGGVMARFPSVTLYAAPCLFSA